MNTEMQNLLPSSQPPLGQPVPEQTPPLLGLLRHLSNFTLFWLGQSLSEIGTRLTGFGLGIWVYQNTHAVTQLSLVFLATTLPGVLLTPFIGALVDRWNRRWIIFFSDCGATLITLVLMLLLLNGRLELWHTYVSAFFTSLCGSFQMLAKGAAVPMLVPKQHLGRVNGLMQFSTAVSMISAPALAGLLIARFQIEGLLLIDLGTYAIGLLTLLFVTIPQPEADSDLAEASQQRSILNEIRAGWEVISSKPVFLVLIAFMSLHYFVDGMTNVLINPLILSFSNTQAFGNAISIGGFGMVAGSLLMSLRGNSNHILSNLVLASMLNGFGLILTGLRPSVSMITCGVFLSYLTIPVIAGSNQSIWQIQIKPSYQGRVLSLVGSITGLAVALGNISASPLADFILEPMFLEEGLLVRSIGWFIGFGPGRGVGFLIILEGLLIVLTAIVVYAYIHWQRLEDELCSSDSNVLASAVILSELSEAIPTIESQETGVYLPVGK